MTGFRLRVVRLGPEFGVGSNLPYAIQISEFGLVWGTLSRFHEFDNALEEAKALADEMEKNFTVRPEAILWTYPKKKDMTPAMK